MPQGYSLEWSGKFGALQEVYNPQGSLHGGVLATALDISMGHLLKQQFGAGATLVMKVSISRRSAAARSPAGRAS